MLLEGVFAAITTPFSLDEGVYYRKLEANMARYSRSLLAGMVVLGSTGEAPLVDDAETREILRVAAEAAAPEKVLIAGVGRESVKTTLELAEVAAKARYDAILVRPAVYYAGSRTPAVLLHHFRSIADRSPLPVILYHVPKHLPCDISVDMVKELAGHPRIVGIKDSAGSVERICAEVAATAQAPRRSVPVTPVFEAVTARMAEPRAEAEAGFVPLGDLAGSVTAGPEAGASPAKKRTRKVGFQVLTGSGSIFLESLQAGATAAVLAFASFAPQACQEVYLAWKDHDLALARLKQQRILAAMQRIVGELGIAGVKYACDFNGYYGGPARAPFMRLTAQEKAEIEALLVETRN